ncbi:MAG: hypothetical protein ACLS63_16795 [Flavonifractor plautii]
MRTAKLTVNGKEYLLCFSVRVLRAVSERYGDVTHIPEALDQEDTVRAMDEAFWILSAMMEAGSRYAAHEGMENPAPLTVDQLYDLCDISDCMGLKNKIAETITAGRAVTVEAEAPKNAGTARGKRSG